MAYYVYFGGNTHQNFCFSQNMPLYSQFNITPYMFPIERFPLSSNAGDHPIPQEPKNTPELPTIAPEENNRSTSQPTKNRRKREKNFERELVSAKKNSQSNIINHFFTFFSVREASETLVKKAILSLGSTVQNLEKSISLTYLTLRVINMKRGRKYINKVLLWNSFSEENIRVSMDKLQNSDELTASQLSVVIRKCLSFFMQQVSLTSILTSKRISKHSKEIHLSKRRKIVRYLNSLIDRY